jgi:hypothetical protein
MADETTQGLAPEAENTLEAGSAALGQAPGEAEPGRERDVAEPGDGSPWYAGLPEEHHQALSGYENGNAALLGLLGKAVPASEGLVKVPGEEATDEERAAFRKALGVPDAAEAYALPEGLELPEGVDLDDDTGRDFRRAAHELGLTDAQFQGVLRWAVPMAAQGSEAAVAEARAFQVAEVEALRKVHGAGTAQLLDDARGAALALGGEELIQALGPAGSDSRVLAALARLAPLVTEGRIKGPEGPQGQSGPVTRASIEAMMLDPRYADPDQRDEGFVAQVREACKRLNVDRK